MFIKLSRQIKGYKWLYKWLSNAKSSSIVVVQDKITVKQLSNRKRNEFHGCVAYGPLRDRNRLKKESEEHIMTDNDQ